MSRISRSIFLCALVLSLSAVSHSEAGAEDATKASAPGGMARDMGQGLGSSMGSSLGASLGGPLGAAAGGYIGGRVGPALGTKIGGGGR